MDKHNQPTKTWALATYRKLLRLYPTSFQERYAEEMQQTFADILEDGPDNFLSRNVLVVRQYMNVLLSSVVEQLQTTKSFLLLGYVLYAVSAMTVIKLRWWTLPRLGGLYGRSDTYNPIINWFGHVLVNTATGQLIVLLVIAATMSYSFVYGTTKKIKLAVLSASLLVALLYVGDMVVFDIALYVNNHIDFTFGNAFRLTSMLVRVILPVAISYVVTNYFAKRIDTIDASEDVLQSA